MVSKLITTIAVGAAVLFTATASAEARDGRVPLNGFSNPGTGGRLPGGGAPGGSFSKGGGGGPIAGGRRGGGGPKFSGGGGRHGGGGKHSRRRGGYGYGYGIPYYFDSYTFVDEDDECYYLWRRYKRTGNLKWKYRYYDCID